MGLYLDDDSRHNKLIGYLEDHGIDVVIPEDFGLGGMPDPTHFERSKQEDRRLVTSNRRDFEILVEENPCHPGIFVWNRENIADKDLDWREVGQMLVEFETSDELETHWPDPPILDLSKFRWVVGDHERLEN